MSANTYDVTLAGYDPSSTLTEELIKWVRAESKNQVELFCQRMGWDVVEIRNIPHADGEIVDYDVTPGGMFINHYSCEECCIDWLDISQHTNSDKCPGCNSAMEPASSEDYSL